MNSRISFGFVKEKKILSMELQDVEISEREILVPKSNASNLKNARIVRLNKNNLWIISFILFLFAGVVYIFLFFQTRINSKSNDLCYWMPAENMTHRESNLTNWFGSCGLGDHTGWYIRGTC